MPRSSKWKNLISNAGNNLIHQWQYFLIKWNRDPAVWDAKAAGSDKTLNDTQYLHQNISIPPTAQHSISHLNGYCRFQFTSICFCYCAQINCVIEGTKFNFLWINMEHFVYWQDLPNFLDYLSTLISPAFIIPFCLELKNLEVCLEARVKKWPSWR